MNTPLALDVNEFCFGGDAISLIHMKNQQKIRLLLNRTDVVNEEQWTKNLSVCVCNKVETVKLFELLGMWYEYSHSESLKLPVKQLIFCEVADCSPATFLNLNTSTNIRTDFGVPKADLGLTQLLRRSSLWH